MRGEKMKANETNVKGFYNRIKHALIIYDFEDELIIKYAEN